jgi:ubiquinone biosynthesis protein Coq4
MQKRYANLEQHSEQSLAHRFYQHMIARKLPLPGAPGSLPEQALQHDLMHVVTGFDTDARGESRLAGFYAGVSSRFPIAGADPFTFVMVALLTFHLGYRVGPGFVATERGAVDPQELWRSIEYGLSAPRSPLANWDFYAEMATPLGDVRARFGLPAAGVQYA